MKLQILQLIIASPNGVLYEGSVELVTLPGEMGSFTILPGHAPIISSLQDGNVKYQENGSLHELNIRSGFVEVSNDIVSVCVER